MALLRDLAAPVWRLLRRAPPTIPPVAVVYGMGKVGSSAVSAALRQAGLVCHHIHTLHRPALIRDARAALEAGELPLRHVSVAMAERAALVRGRGEVRYVTLVRDPVARTLSAFFENLHRHKGGLAAESDPDRLFAAWLEETDHRYGLTWFDREYRDQLGIDVMAHPFDPARRLAQLPGRGPLVMRIDCPGPQKEAALSALYGRPIRIALRNIGADKRYGSAYAAVLARACIPPELADEVYGSAFVRKFWTPEEAGAMADRWTGGRRQA